MNIRLLSSLLLFFCCLACAKTQKEDPLVLWYNEPAENWNEALPVGNGRAGAMRCRQGAAATERKHAL